MQSHTKQNPLSVSQLTSKVKSLLESSIGQVWVSGEITSFRPARSGHWYFSLKDAHSQIRINMWRSTTYRVDFQPKEGDQVLVYGPLNIYAPRGEYSLIAEWMEPLGKGDMRAGFERLKALLQEEGLFEPSHKKQLPLLPRRIGVVTSKTGAALQDILNVLNRRFSGVTVVVADSKVQGVGAAKDLTEAIKLLERRGRCDVIIIGRGGGSEEDLWAFNDEELVRTVFKTKVPVISAIGHEIDFTLTDFVADVRAATPSQAAELVIRTKEEYSAQIQSARVRLNASVRAHIHSAEQRLNKLHFKEVFHRLRLSCNDRFQTIEMYREQLQWKIENRLEATSYRLEHLTSRLHQVRANLDIPQKQHDIEQLMNHLELQIQHTIGSKRSAMTQAVGTLEALSPLKVLARGYSLIKDEKGNVIRNTDETQIGQELKATLHEGRLKVRVLEKF